MDISKIGSETINNEELKTVQAEALARAAAAKKAEKKDETEKSADSVGLGSFDKLKATVKESKDPLRVKMVEDLKEKFKAGKLDFDSKDIADAMMKDKELMDLLVS